MDFPIIFLSTLLSLKNPALWNLQSMNKQSVHHHDSENM